MADKQVEYLYQSGERLLVVTDVPCLECAFCGERYFEAVVLKRLDFTVKEHQS
ncbi:MAG: YgiT-type zinc finger protein [Magnetococcales bacterium]|nr:YgiT-type zinc finger protein [Magnetococcales bacterium]NGZ06873.1 YgiT-type zinc finger protein [Magnetococcales bacterium]